VHPSELLWAEHAPAGGYPPGVLAVPAPIPGTAFFPGGYGVWDSGQGRPLPPFPVGGTIVLGQDFHFEAGYQASARRGEESPTLPTWRNLLALFGAAGIAPGDCFFTNDYMGLRAGAGTTGRFPGASSPGFVAHCRRFLLRQMEVQRPSLVLTLGVNAPGVIAPLSPELAPWAAGRGLKHLDAVGPVRAGVSFPGLSGFVTVAAALTHPSLHAAGVRHRRYGGAAGGPDELLMLRDALAAARASVG
jgi:hypothetical protein